MPRCPLANEAFSSNKQVKSDLGTYIFGPYKIIFPKSDFAIAIDYFTNVMRLVFLKLPNSSE